MPLCTEHGQVYGEGCKCPKPHGVPLGNRVSNVTRADFGATAQGNRIAVVIPQKRASNK